jgi:hypothetical protein
MHDLELQQFLSEHFHCLESIPQSHPWENCHKIFDPALKNLSVQQTEMLYTKFLVWNHTMSKVCNPISPFHSTSKPSTYCEGCSKFSKSYQQLPLREVWQTTEAHVTFHAENNFGCDAKSNKCAI